LERLIHLCDEKIAHNNIQLFFERSSNCWLSDFIAEGKLYIEHPYTKACDEVNGKNQRKG
jgi:hypothetical protein